MTATRRSTLENFSSFTRFDFTRWFDAQSVPQGVFTCVCCWVAGSHFTVGQRRRSQRLHRRRRGGIHNEMAEGGQGQTHWKQFGSRRSHDYVEKSWCFGNLKVNDEGGTTIYLAILHSFAARSINQSRGLLIVSRRCSQGDLNGLIAYLESECQNGKTGCLATMSEQCFGGTPTMAVAAHYGHLHIVEYLANRPELDDTLSDPERTMVCTACQAGDTERVLALLDGIYADQLKRSQLMSAFLMQDVDSAKSRILQYKHREKAIRQGQDKRYVIISIQFCATWV